MVPSPNATHATDAGVPMTVRHRPRDQRSHSPSAARCLRRCQTAVASPRRNTQTRRNHGELHRRRCVSVGVSISLFAPSVQRTVIGAQHGRALGRH
eukprot:m.1299036 g.1299036  ORF g.1299036 m.1299036 type:complete len:96 (-) comp24800_c0_seq11:1603-1890(-)